MGTVPRLCSFFIQQLVNAGTELGTEIQWGQDRSSPNGRDIAHGGERPQTVIQICQPGRELRVTEKINQANVMENLSGGGYDQERPL